MYDTSMGFCHFRFEIVLRRKSRLIFLFYYKNRPSYHKRLLTRYINSIHCLVKMKKKISKRPTGRDRNRLIHILQYIAHIFGGTSNLGLTAGFRSLRNVKKIYFPRIYLLKAALKRRVFSLECYIT